MDRSDARDRHAQKHSRRSNSPDGHAGSSSRGHDDRDRHRHRRDRHGQDHHESLEKDDRTDHRPRDTKERSGERHRHYSRYERDEWEEKTPTSTSTSKTKSKSKSRSNHKKRTRRDTPSDDDDLLDIRKMGIRPISEDDYFVKASEFKFWLKDSRDKDFHEMDSDSTRRYFRKFVRRWNDGALKEKYYGQRQPHLPSTSTNIKSRPDFPQDTRSPSPGPQPITSRLDANAITGLSRIGPTLPSQSDLQLALETQRESAQARYRQDQKVTRTKALERAEDIAPKLGGREGKMAEKRAVNSANKEMRDKEVGGLELDEATLMGEGGSFQAALKARDAAAARRKEKKEADMINLRSANEERLAERRQKENETMQMLQAMAKQRYG